MQAVEHHGFLPLAARSCGRIDVKGRAGSARFGFGNSPDSAPSLGLSSRDRAGGNSLTRGNARVPPRRRKASLWDSAGGVNIQMVRHGVTDQ